MDFQGIVDAMVSHAATLGRFEKVNRHELKGQPGPGLTAAVWVQSAVALSRASGLASVSVLLTMRIRLYSNAIIEPQESIDPAVMIAAKELMAAYCSNFTLGGLVRNVDLLGENGTPLQANAGYLTINQTMYRIFDLDVPMVINDVFTEAP